MADEVWTTGAVLAWIEGYLRDHGDANPRLSAQWLVADALGQSRIQLYADMDYPLNDRERETLREYTRRRCVGEPLQYITGSTDFRFVTLAVEPGVLIPRPETEVLVSEALAELKQRFPDMFSDTLPRRQCKVADVCTGSGNIALSIASEVPFVHVVATDVSPAAVDLARRNAARLGLEGRVEVLKGDLCAPIPAHDAGTFALLVSNPPYIPSAALAELDDEVARFEPRLALDGGLDGLGIFRRILPAAQNLLVPGGVFAVELHEECLDAACEQACAAGFADVRIANDLAGKPRVLVGVCATAPQRAALE